MALTGVYLEQQQQAELAYKRALADINTSQGQLLQQFGYKPVGNYSSDTLGMSNLALDPSNPLGLLQQNYQLETEGRGQAGTESMLRGLNPTRGGLGAQGQYDVREKAGAQRGELAKQLISGLTQHHSGRAQAKFALSGATLAAKQAQIQEQIQREMFEKTASAQAQQHQQSLAQQQQQFNASLAQQQAELAAAQAAAAAPPPAEAPPPSAGGPPNGGQGGTLISTDPSTGFGSYQFGDGSVWTLTSSGWQPSSGGGGGGGYTPPPTSWAGGGAPPPAMVQQAKAIAQKAAKNRSRSEITYLQNFNSQWGPVSNW